MNSHTLWLGVEVLRFGAASMQLPFLFVEDSQSVTSRAPTYILEGTSIKYNFLSRPFPFTNIILTFTEGPKSCAMHIQNALVWAWMAERHA
jgi:hypothetical protein